MKLTPRQLILCERTISANAFFHLVSHAITTDDNLSVVRAADGEKKLLTHCPEPGNPLLMPFGGLTEDWLVRFGCLGIPRPLLALRIVQAVTECHYYAPSMSGITMPEYDVYDLSIRNSYVDNQFPNLWTEEQKAQLFVEAGHVTLIHASRKLADAMQARAKKYHGVKVQYLPLTNWRESDSVIAEANRIGAPLTIFAAGPASKFIGPRIKGVTLDIGQAMDRWTFLPQFEREKQRAKESGVLDQFMRSPYAANIPERKHA
jgi:hypothetical protein